MPQERSVRASSGPKTKRAGWGYVGLFACMLAVAVTGCASTATSSPVGAGTPLVATSDTSQTSTTDLSSPSLDAPATSAPPTSALPSTAPPATSAAPLPKPVTTTDAAAPKPSLCGAPVNPFGYNFCGRGGYIYGASPARVCSYFNCIANFGVSKGYMIECNDRTYSTAGGRKGACSDHTGVLRPVYSG
jgi:hypothetical protein